MTSEITFNPIRQAKCHFTAVIGNRGTGKSEETMLLLQEAAKERAVLVVDTNNKYNDLQAIQIEDIWKFTSNGIRRVVPVWNFKGDSDKWRSRILDTIFNHFRNGVLVIDDARRYKVTYTFMGAVGTCRQSKTDIIAHYNSINELPHKLTALISYMRLHRTTQPISSEKAQDKTELLRMAQILTEQAYQKGNRDFRVYADFDNHKIIGGFTEGEYISAMEIFMASNKKCSQEQLMEYIN